MKCKHCNEPIEQCISLLGPCIFKGYIHSETYKHRCEPTEQAGAVAEPIKLEVVALHAKHKMCSIEGPHSPKECRLWTDIPLDNPESVG